MAKNVTSAIKALEKRVEKLTAENDYLQRKKDETIKECDEKIIANTTELKSLDKKLKKAKLYEQKIAELFEDDAEDDKEDTNENTEKNEENNLTIEKEIENVDDQDSGGPENVLGDENEQNTENVNQNVNQPEDSNNENNTLEHKEKNENKDNNSESNFIFDMDLDEKNDDSKEAIEESGGFFKNPWTR